MDNIPGITSITGVFKLKLFLIWIFEDTGQSGDIFRISILLVLVVVSTGLSIPIPILLFHRIIDGSGYYVYFKYSLPKGA
jgi:hypothetical protein